MNTRALASICAVSLSPVALIVFFSFLSPSIRAQQKETDLSEFLQREILVRANGFPGPNQWEQMDSNRPKSTPLYQQVGRSPRQPGSQVRLIFMEPFRDELELSAEQQKQIAETLAGGRQQFQELEKRFDLEDDEKSRQQIANEALAVSVRCEGKMLEVVLPSQWKRVDKLLYAGLFSRMGYVGALTDSPLSEKLNVTPEQREKIVDAAQNLHSEMSKRMHESIAEKSEKILKHLTDEQRQKIGELIDSDNKEVLTTTLHAFKTELQRAIGEYAQLNRKRKQKIDTQDADDHRGSNKAESVRNRNNPTGNDSPDSKAASNIRVINDQSALYSAIGTSPGAPRDKLGLILSPGYKIHTEISLEQENEIAQLQAEGMLEYVELEQKYDRATTDAARTRIENQARALSETYHKRMSEVILPYQWNRLDALSFQGLFQRDGLLRTVIVGGISDVHLKVSDAQREAMIEQAKDLISELDAEIAKIHREICDQLVGPLDADQKKTLKQLLGSELADSLKPSPDIVIAQLNAANKSQGRVVSPTPDPLAN